MDDEQQQHQGPPGFGGINLSHVVDRIREFHQQLFGGGGLGNNGTGGAAGGGAILMGPMGAAIPPPMIPFGMGPPLQGLPGPAAEPLDPAREPVPDQRPPPV